MKTKHISATKVRHKLVLQKMSENVGKTQAMIEAGYSKSYAESGHIISTKAWPELLNETLPDELLMAKHKEGLSSTYTKGDQVEADYHARFKYLESAYKLKKRYDNTLTIKGGISQLSSGEIEDAIASEVSTALAALTGEEPPQASLSS